MICGEGYVAGMVASISNLQLVGRMPGAQNNPSWQIARKHNPQSYSKSNFILSITSEYRKDFEPQMISQPGLAP